MIVIFIKFLKKKRIVIYGAGQIGTCAMAQLMMNSTPFDDVEVVLYSPNNAARVAGAEMDLQDACFFVNRVSQWKFIATSDVSMLKDATTIFLCAGKFPTAEDYQNAEKIGIDDRLVQAVLNIPLLNEFVENIKASPNASIFVLSNPVDLMTETLRGLLPGREIYGLGCALDSARFHRELSEMIEAKSGVKCPLIFGDIIGFHNGTMFVKEGSVDFPERGRFSKEELSEMIQTALEKTRSRGLTITRQNEGAATKKLNNGAYWAPAIMIASIIESLVWDFKSRFVLNRQIQPEESKELSGQYAQLSCYVSSKGVKPCCDRLTNNDVANLKKCFAAYADGAERLKAYMQKK